MDSTIITQIKFDENGLVPVIVQDMAGEVIMLAYMNMDALSRTMESGKMHYYSRSRQRLWLKGEESKNYQMLKSIFVDCDSDTLLCRVEQSGGACHKGYYSCFFRELKEGLPVVKERLFDPGDVYKEKKQA